MKPKSQKEIKLKTGQVLPKGLSVTFNREIPRLCTVFDPSTNHNYVVRVTSAFPRPEMDDDFQSGLMDGICESVLGNPVEPDGWSFDGSPSWPLALGIC